MALAGPALATDDPNAPWPWPVPVDPPQITATFMEARSGGYHTGLDIRTLGRTGLPVRTPLGGSVVRVRVSPEGYGKAVYLAVGGGRTLVFAHLLAFADPIQERIRARQAATREYAQQIYLEPGELEFEAGDVIALSGDTGTGAPHLHLEVRDGDVPINPIDFFDVPDREPPVIRGLRVVPIAPAPGRGPFAAFLPTAASHGDTVDVVGAAGLQVDVEERTGLNRFRLLPRRVTLELVDGTNYAVDFGRVAFAERWQRGLVAEWHGGRRWINLFRRPGLTHLDDSPWDGRLEVDGLVPVVVRVEDHRGQSAATRIVLRGPRGRAASGADGAWKTAAEGGAAFGLEPVPGGLIVFDREQPRGVVFGGPDGSGVDFEAGFTAPPPPGTNGRPTPRAWVRAFASGVVRSGTLRLGGRAEWTVVTSGSPAPFVAFAGGSVRVVDPTPDDFSTDTILRIEPVDTDAPARHDGLGVAFEVVAPGVAFRRGVEVSVEVPGDPTEYTLNARSRRGRWSPESGVEPDPDRPNALRTRLVDTGIYRVVRDVRPPAVGPWRVDGEIVRGEVTLRAREDVVHGVTRPRWPALVLDVADAVAGIEPEGVRVFVDGTPYPARPELEDDHVWIEWDVDPGPGTYEVRVEVTDRLGHAATARLGVVLVE